MKEKVKRLNDKIHIPTLLFCAGCVFPMSASFMEMSEMIKEKVAFAGMLTTLLSCVVSILCGKPQFSHLDRILKTFVFLCLVEMGVVIFQILGLLPSLHTFFRFTGTFHNPSILAMMMSLCLPICVYYIIATKDKNKSSWYFMAICVLSCIVLSESRTCLIAAMCSSFAIAFMEIPVFRSYVSMQRAWIPFLICCIILLIVLYYYKRDSADGRILIWTISLRMIAEKPFFGWGENGFSAEYMPHQAAFFLENPDSTYSYLADNVSHPFNEFLLLGIKYGLVGIVALTIITVFLVKSVLQGKHRYKSLCVAISVTLLVLALFSFPYTVPMIWLVSTFLVCWIVASYNLASLKAKMPVLLVLFISIAYILFYNRNVYREWQWQKLQISQYSKGDAYHKYNDLYTHLSNNSTFLYNYGAWLHHNGYYGESLNALSECQKLFDDYNVELLMADNFKQLGKVKNAIETFEYANTMIPCRFLPLYHTMVIYEGEEDSVNACRVARIIIHKPVKIERSSSIKKIKYEAEVLIKRLKNKVANSSMVSPFYSNTTYDEGFVGKEKIKDRAHGQKKVATKHGI